MGDVLGAASLMATVVAILYSLWYPEISDVFRLEWREFHADRKAQLPTIKRALWAKAVPLALVSALPALVFAPDVSRVVVDALRDIGQGRTSITYDSVRAALVGVYVLIVLLVVVAIVQAMRVWRLLRAWSARDDPAGTSAPSS